MEAQIKVEMECIHTASGESRPRSLENAWPRLTLQLARVWIMNPFQHIRGNVLWYSLWNLQQRWIRLVNLVVIIYRKTWTNMHMYWDHIHLVFFFIVICTEKSLVYLYTKIQIKLIIHSSIWKVAWHIWSQTKESISKSNKAKRLDVMKSQKLGHHHKDTEPKMCCMLWAVSSTVIVMLQ